MPTRKRKAKRVAAPNTAPVLQGVRIAHLRQLAQEHGGVTDLARKLGQKNHTYLAGLLMENPSRPLGEKAARSIETKLGLPTGWFDGGPREEGTVDQGLLEQVALAALKATAGLAPGKIARLIAVAYADAARLGRFEPATLDILVQVAR